LRRRIIEFNSGRNQHGNHHGNRRKPDTDNNIVRYGPVTGAAALGPSGDGPGLCAAHRKKTVATASCCAVAVEVAGMCTDNIRSRDEAGYCDSHLRPTLACLLFIGIPVRPRRWRNLIGMLVLLAFLAGSVMSCGGGGSAGGGGISNPGTTTGSYTVTVSGTSGSTTQTTTVNLTVN
jgi:hypothetical protein